MPSLPWACNQGQVRQICARIAAVQGDVRSAMPTGMAVTSGRPLEALGL